MNHIEKLNVLFSIEKCCLRCIWRIFWSQDQDVTFRKIKDYITEEIYRTAELEKFCPYCDGLVGSSDSLIPKIVQNLSKYEIESIQVGSSINQSTLLKDEKFEKWGLHPLPLKLAINNFMSDKLSEQLQVKITQDDPTVTIVLRTKKKMRFEIQVKSVYLLGRYVKKIRGIPQTKWPCTNCKGKKCEVCNFSGQQYPTSVEAEISKYPVELSGAISSSFHGAGREDIDAKMLGNGRPFVLELKKPLKRTLSLKKIENEINKGDAVNINSLRYCNKEIIKKIKSESAFRIKVYRAKVRTHQEIGEKESKKIALLGNKLMMISQKTPIRVSHRRTDKLRKKDIYFFRIIENLGREIILEIKAQGGAYIKEFISGDEGRTHPSFSSIVKQPAVCVELDVVDVDSEDLFHVD